MKAAARIPRVRPQEPDSDLPNRCDIECEARVRAAEIIAASNDRIAASTDRSAAALELAITTFTPVAHAAEKGIDKLDKLCMWLRKWTVVILFAAPWLFVFTGALTPHMAQLFAHALSLIGW